MIVVLVLLENFQCTYLTSNMTRFAVSSTAIQAICAPVMVTEMLPLYLYAI